jgi:phytoene synthase
MTLEAAVPPGDGVAAAATPDASGSSFYWAMRLLPRARREAMFAVYAYCRAIDDIADSFESHEARLATLGGWRAELDALYAGRPTYPALQRLLEPVAEFRLRRADLMAVLEGMEMDAREDIRAPSLAELDLYCDRVASAVGRLSVRIFGLEDAEGVPLAHDLGRAFQLTNILRDLGEDAERGRLYLPRELLRRHGVEAREPQEVLDDPGCRAACRDLAARAEAHFAAARRHLQACPRSLVRPALVMEGVYRRLLGRLRRADWRDPGHRVSVPRPVKLWVAVRHGLL